MCTTDVVASRQVEHAAELDALMADPDAEVTAEEAEEWFAYVDASKPPYPEEVIIEEGDEWPEPTAAERAWDEWYERPISESLFDRLSVRLHVAADLGLSTRTPTASARGTSRERRTRSSGRPKTAARGDPDREPPLTPLTRPERQGLRRLIDRAVRERLASVRECRGCGLDLPLHEFRGRRICRSCESSARMARRLKAAA